MMNVNSHKDLVSSCQLPVAENVAVLRVIV